MINLRKSLAVWGTPDFETRLRGEIEELDAGLLPLQQGLSQGSYVIDAKFRAMLISAAEEATFLRVKLGIFYSAIIAGCSCADDPTPVDELPEYCQIELLIDKPSGDTAIRLMTDHCPVDG